MFTQLLFHQGPRHIATTREPTRAMKIASRGATVGDDNFRTWKGSPSFAIGAHGQCAAFTAPPLPRRVAGTKMPGARIARSRRSLIPYLAA
jgi:hypothetical protein